MWAPAAFAGGKLFAPLMFLAVLPQLGTLRGTVRSGLRADILVVIALLVWLAVTALWSPANLALVSGSMADGDFSIDAPQIRFGLTILAAGLFLAAALRWDAAAEARLPLLLLGAICILLAGLLAVTPLRQTIIDARGEGLLPSAQSIGRALNLLALSLPLALGVVMIRWPGRRAWVTCAAVVGVFVIVGIFMDGAAAVIGLLAGVIVLGALHIWPERGWRRLFDLLSIAVIATPMAVWMGTAALSGVAASLPVSAHQRLLIWEATLQRVAAKPLFGHGADASSAWHSTFAEEPDWLALMPENFALVRIIPGHPHNMALQVWAETGLVGAALLAAAFALFGRTVPPPSHLSSGIRLAAAGIFGVAITLFFVSYSAWDESFWAALAIVCAALVCLNKMAERGS